jgi:hypothetical protein
MVSSATVTLSLTARASPEGPLSPFCHNRRTRLKFTDNALTPGL